jgi:hypothetical protein
VFLETKEYFSIVGITYTNIEIDHIRENTPFIEERSNLEEMRIFFYNCVYI